MSKYLLLGANFGINIFRTIGLAIDGIIYMLTAKAYEVFLLVSEAQLFDDSTALINEVTDRVYSILGIAMLFILAYNIIKLIIDPDKLTSSDDSSLSGIAKNLVISIIIIALLPTCFKYIYQFQDRVLKTNVLSRLVLGNSADSGEEFTIRSAGKDVALTIFSSFFHPVDSEGNIFTVSDCQNSGIENKPEVCGEYVSAMNGAIENGKPSILYKNKTLKNAEDDEVEYLFLASTIAGVFALYLFISFALDLGVRVVKLGVLQVMAPIPVILRVTKPKGGFFDKWFKEISKTYLMVFERLLVIYFAILMLQLICSSNGGMFANLSAAGKSETGALVIVLAKAIVILGTLTFAKEAPKMLEDLIGSKMPEWRIKKKLDDNEYAKRLTSAAGTSGLSFISNVAKGKFGAAFESLPVGLAKGWKNGNVGSFSDMKGAITKSRIETNQSVDKINEFVTNPGASIAERVNDAKNYILEDSTKNEQLEVAKRIEEMLKLFTSQFEDGSITAAKKATLDNVSAGKDIVLPNTITEKAIKFNAKGEVEKDSNGNIIYETDSNGDFITKTFTAGQNITAADREKYGIDAKYIKKLFDGNQMNNYEEKYRKLDTEYIKAIKEHGKNLIVELKKQAAITGIPADTEDLEKIFADGHNIDRNDIKYILDRTAAAGNDVKSLTFQATTQKKKEDKK